MFIPQKRNTSPNSPYRLPMILVLMKHRRKPSGFALIATLSMMLLLVVVAVGLLSISTIALKTSTLGSNEAKARANARMALTMAIGELQRTTGLDTRVTASSTIVDENSPPILGVWKSWEGTNHDDTGRPIAPDYDSKQDPEGRFLTWLVSTATDGAAPTNPSSLASNTASEDAIPMVAEGSLGDDSTQKVYVVPTTLSNSTERSDQGRYAWWITGDNQKARLAQPHEPRNSEPSALAEMGQSHAVPNPEVFGLGDLTDDREPHNPSTAAQKGARKTLTRQTIALISDNNPVEPDHKFHDFTTHSVGLLTNTATGGWRKDMSLLTEDWADIYSRYSGGRLPLFRLSPETGETTQVPLPTTSNYEPAQADLYPWSEYSLVLGYRQPCTYHAASASWASLVSFATAYKNLTDGSVGPTSPFIWSKVAKQRANQITSSEMYNHKHRIRLHPQIARFQFVVYARAIEDPGRMGQTPTRYQTQMLYVPVFTLWNPYNLTLEHEISGTLNGGQGSGTHRNFLGFGMRRSVPCVMAFRLDNPNPPALTDYRLLTNGNFQALDNPSNNSVTYDSNLPENLNKFGGGTWADLRTWGCWLPEGTLQFRPGEVKVYSPEFRDTGYGFGGGCFRLKEGFDAANLVGYNRTLNNNMTANRTYSFHFRNDRYTKPYQGRDAGYGFSLSWGDGGSHFGGTATHPSGIGDEYHNLTALVSDNDGEAYWPSDELDEIQYTVGELAGRWTPLYSASFGPRMTLGIGPGTDQNRPTKGVLQNNPMAGMVISDPGSGEAKDHPVNNTYDFAYHTLAGNSTITPSLTNSEGYIGTGSQVGDGLSRLIMAEIPLRPMASLIELQGWNPKGQNPHPPMHVNLIGNSDASPLIPSNQVIPSQLSPAGDEFNLMHDDSYCANHLLFDDWFLSSIAHQPTTFGGTIEKNLEAVYREFLEGDFVLTNRAYQPIPEDRGLSGTALDELVTEITDSPDGDSWLKIASRLEVEGMFNVNSTSVEAWKALLSQAKSRERLAIHAENGIESVENDKIAVTRGSIATDVEAGTGAGVGSGFANGSEYAGYRTLTDDQIQNLAEEIVDQVRLRGPFLSLSEFINRQLSNDEDLALAGAIQTAINNMTDDPMAELRNPANSLSDTTMAANDPKLGNMDYAFEEAAEGDSAYGAPGWIRQADILRPIAPILSARDDTFTIRAYGDALDEKGNIVARAWCEATVKRTRDFCNDTDEPDSVDPPTDDYNVIFGRRYVLTSFKWLNASEV